MMLDDEPLEKQLRRSRHAPRGTDRRRPSAARSSTSRQRPRMTVDEARKGIELMHPGKRSTRLHN
jgi:hypothetical protein